MFKFLIIWLLANYSYENISDTYKSYKTENPIQEITSFIDKQQYREDQLREHCNLQNFMMKDKPNYYDSFIDTMIDVKHSLTTTLYKNMLNSLNYQDLIYTTQMNANTYEDFINLSHSPENKGKEIIYDEHTYILLHPGVKVDAGVYSYSNQQYYPIPKNPTWMIQLGENVLTISDIKSISDYL